MPEFKGARQAAFEFTNLPKTNEESRQTVAFVVLDFNPTFEPITRSGTQCTRCEGNAAVFQDGELVGLWVIERGKVGEEMPADRVEAIEFCREDTRVTLLDPEHPIYSTLATFFDTDPFYGPKCDDHADVSLP